MRRYRGICMEGSGGRQQHIGFKGVITYRGSHQGFETSSSQHRGSRRALVPYIDSEAVIILSSAPGVRDQGDVV